MAFEAQGPNGPFMITVAKVNDNDTITVDLNHPMAGKQLHFDVNVVEVREPTAEELAKVAASLSSGCGCGDSDGGSKNADACGCADDSGDAPTCGSGCNCG